MAVTEGLWNIGSFNIPDFGISEFLGIGPYNSAQNPNVNSLQNTPTQQASVQDYNTRVQSAVTPSTNPNQNIFALGLQSGSTTNTGGNNNNTVNWGGQTFSAPSSVPSGWTPAQWAADLAYRQRQAEEQRQRAYNNISSGWDNYLGSLNDIANNFLPQQKTAQENIAQSQYNQGYNTLSNDKQQGLSALDRSSEKVNQNQAKSLRDLSSNLKNSFMAGNIYLGARGAGDSSAANQYSYALTNLGSKQRTDVMNNSANLLADIETRKNDLQNTYNTNVKNLQETMNQQINQVATWFANAQVQLKQAMASGQLGKSKDLENISNDILNRSLAEIDRIKQQGQTQYNALQTWALSNAKDINQLSANMKGISQFSAPLPTASPLVGTPQVGSDGSYYVPAGYGGGSGSNDTQQQTSLFQNPSWF